MPSRLQRGFACRRPYYSPRHGGGSAPQHRAGGRAAARSSVPLNTRLDPHGRPRRRSSRSCCSRSRSPGPARCRRPALPPSFDGETAVRSRRSSRATIPAACPAASGADGAARWVADEARALRPRRRDGRCLAEDVPDLGERPPDERRRRRPGRDARDDRLVLAHRDTDGPRPGCERQRLGHRGAGRARAGVRRRRDHRRRAHGRSTRSSSSRPTAARTAASARRASRSARGSATGSLAVVVARRPRRAPTATARAGRRPTAARRLRRSCGRRPRESRSRRGRGPESPGVLRQLVDLALPFGYGEQAPFLGEGISALRLTTADDSGAAEATDTPERLDQARFAQLGTRSAVSARLARRRRRARAGNVGAHLRSATTASCAAGRSAHVFSSPRSPFLVGVIDLLARCRRRGLSLAPAIRPFAAVSPPALWAGLVLLACGGAGRAPPGVDRPLPPDGSAATDWPVAGLAGLGLLATAGWLARARPATTAAPPSAEEELAGYAVALTALGMVALATAVVSPLFARSSSSRRSTRGCGCLQVQRAETGWLRDALFALGSRRARCSRVVSLEARFDLGDRRPRSTSRRWSSVGYLPWTTRRAVPLPGPQWPPRRDARVGPLRRLRGRPCPATARTLSAMVSAGSCWRLRRDAGSGRAAPLAQLSVAARNVNEGVGGARRARSCATPVPRPGRAPCRHRSASRRRAPCRHGSGRAQRRRRGCPLS